MEESAVCKIVQDAVDKLKQEMNAKIMKMEEENKKGREEILFLKDENEKLKKQMVEMSRTIDDVEQYSRKDSLILGGGGFPEVQGGKYETPEETREITKKVIEEKLGVKLSGQISACHRLRNNKRVIIKFQDLDDRNAVYESKFNQMGAGQGQRIVIHENLTAKRAKQVQALGEMWEQGQVSNYYTKNGVIMARKTKEHRYVPVRPDMTRTEIVAATEEAPLKSTQPTQNKNFLKSQSLTNIPPGRVANQRADLEQIATMTLRSSSRGGAGAGRAGGSGGGHSA